MWALIRPRRNWFISTGWGWLTKTGVYTSLRRLFSFSQVNECNRDITSTRPKFLVRHLLTQTLGSADEE